MESFLSGAERDRAVGYIDDRIKLTSLQEQRLREFLETLETDQLALLYQTGLIIDMLAQKETIPQVEGAMAFPDASEHRPFDYDEWKNQKG